jgi:hypothetical protein
MAAAIERLTREGWEAEAEPRFGFAFIRGAGERRLLMLTSNTLDSPGRITILDVWIVWSSNPMKNSKVSLKGKSVS